MLQNNEMSCMKVVLIELGGLVLYGLFALHIALVPLLYQDTKTETVVTQEQQPVIFEDTILITACVIGSFIGALINVYIFPVDVKVDPSTALQRTATKLLACVLSGVLFAPMAIKYMHLDFNRDSLIFIAGMTAMLGVSVLEVVVPLISTKIQNLIKSKVE
jgi:hypothetical protein